MVVCTFFQQGYCRFGSSCRFEHVYPSKYSYRAPQTQQAQPQQSGTAVTDDQLLHQVRSDTQSVLSGNQWILSCYSPYKEKQNFPGLTDHSPEEIRLSVYEAKSNNTVDQTISYINSLVQDATFKYKKLFEPDENIMRTLKSIYKGETPPDPFTSIQTPYSPGRNPNSNQAASIFASASQSVFGSPGSSGVTTPGIFGSQNKTPSVFGSPSPASVFGGQNTTPTPASVFGGQTSPASVFGGQNVTASPASVFSGQASPASVFGQAASQNQTPSVFGVQSPAQQQAQSIFANQNLNQPQQAASVFGGAAQQLFGSPQPQTNAFQQNQNPFGGQQNVTSENVFQQSSVFGSSQPQQTGVFGQPQVVVDESTIYSKIEELTQEDLEAYNSDSFKLGFIPETPPPRSLCV